MAHYGMDYGGDSGGGYGGGFSQGGGGGGGFGASQGGGASQREGGQRRNYDEQTLLPVTIRMALASRSSDADGNGSYLLEDDRKLHHVKVVAAVRSVEESSTNCTYTLEDGTGLIDCKQWIDDNDCTAQQELRQNSAKESIYVKVIGQIKEFEGKKTILASSVRPLLTGNELTHHVLEVVYAAEKYRRADSIVAPFGAGSPMQISNSPMGGVGFGSARGPVAAPGGGDALYEAVVQFVRDEGSKSENGANIHDCISQLCSSGKFTEAQVRQQVDFLSSEGVIYSTVNEDFFQHSG